MSMTNVCVGDALSDLLLVEAILAIEQKTMACWERDYTELPSCLLKVHTGHLDLRTEDADRRVVSPAGLQNQIDQILSCYPSGRSFVRPSGTEPVVRIYAEATTPEDARALGAKVEGLLNSYDH